jgi:hypothetical protein
MAIRKRQQSNNTITFDQVLPTVVGKTQSPNVAGTLPDALVSLFAQRVKTSSISSSL